MFTCKRCLQKFIHLQDLEIHFVIHDRYISPLTMRCVRCGKKYDNDRRGKQNMFKHMKREHTLPAVCVICLKTFKSATALQDHVKRNPVKCISPKMKKEMIIDHKMGFHCNNRKCRKHDWLIHYILIYLFVSLIDCYLY